MKKRRKWMILAMALILGLCGCQNSEQESADVQQSEQSGTDAEAGEEPYKFALVAPMTGNNAQFGQAYRASCMMLIDDINANGGINGHEVILDVFDDKNDPKECVNVANIIVSDPSYLGVIGSQTSSCCMAVAPIFQEAGITMIAPSASHPDLVSMGEYIFRVTLTQELEAREYADFVTEKMGMESFAIIYCSDDWGVAVNQVFTEQVENSGAEVLVSETFIPNQTKDFTSLISKCKESGAECLFIVGQYAESAQIIQQCKNLEYEPELFYGTAMWYQQEFIDLLGENGEGLVFCGNFDNKSQDPYFLEFDERLQEKEGIHIDQYVAQSHDAMELFLNAVEKAGADREKIRDEIAATTEFHGLMGTWSYDPETREPDRELFPQIIQNGQFVSYDGIQ